MGRNLHPAKPHLHNWRFFFLSIIRSFPYGSILARIANNTHTWAVQTSYCSVHVHIMHFFFNFKSRIVRWFINGFINRLIYEMKYQQAYIFFSCCNTKQTSICFVKKIKIVNTILLRLIRQLIKHISPCKAKDIFFIKLGHYGSQFILLMLHTPLVPWPFHCVINAWMSEAPMRLSSTASSNHSVTWTMLNAVHMRLSSFELMAT